MKKVISVTVVIICFILSPAMAQTQTVKVQKAELSVPFGIAPGKLMIVADYLVFIDEEKQEMSFAIARSNIKNLKTEAGTIAVELGKPVRDRSGERSRLTFRLAEDGDPAAVSSWASAGSTATGPTEGEETGSESYEAKHKHLIGDCRGRLIITEDRLIYESIDDLGDSRKWAFKDIKEMRLRNPYRLDIEPFDGNKYSFELLGRGMDTQDYRELVDRVTAVRTGQ